MYYVYFNHCIHVAISNHKHIWWCYIINKFYWLCCYCLLWKPYEIGDHCSGSCSRNPPIHSCKMTLYNYHICGIIGKSNNWQIALKMKLASVLIGGFETAWKEIHAYSLNGIHLIWWSRRDSPNRQIKAITKYTTYTILENKVGAYFYFHKKLLDIFTAGRVGAPPFHHLCIVKV